ncbi:hypothetical protein Agabi119p4_4998 [Agaricus bisporus var. burnettii]|uniref:Uncharacterized protein n=1 Tax=Agaricus bisporus var. burnettii TaxID=192524 RepID=A0A8H7F4G3_AGABI|nr:hypothetical protein Agabi119p4_4998 [Agaricus bisporus var. burnettii]
MLIIVTKWAVITLKIRLCYRYISATKQSSPSPCAHGRFPVLTHPIQGQQPGIRAKGLLNTHGMQALPRIYALSQGIGSIQIQSGKQSIQRNFQNFHPAFSIPMGLTNWLKKPAIRPKNWNTVIPFARSSNSFHAAKRKLTVGKCVIGDVICRTVEEDETIIFLGLVVCNAISCTSDRPSSKDE